MPFLPCFCYALKCGCRVKTITRSVKILENARALAGPFRKVAFIVSIGGCGLQNLKVVKVFAGKISRHISYMDLAERKINSTIAKTVRFKQRQIRSPTKKSTPVCNTHMRTTNVK